MRGDRIAELYETRQVPYASRIQEESWTLSSSLNRHWIFMLEVIGVDVLDFNV